MKVYDCFTFFNELDLLEIRLTLLDEVVDYFVIAEANFTHSGDAKDYIYKTNVYRYSKFNHKIIYIPVAFDLQGLNINKSQESHNLQNDSWVLENKQREALWQIKNRIAADDIVLISDLDEIPKPSAIAKAKKQTVPISFKMASFNYFMNCYMRKSQNTWRGTCAVNGSYFLQNSPQKIRDDKATFERFRNAGWHFSYLGGIDKIRLKLQSFAHTEYNKPAFTSIEAINAALTAGKDVLKRDGVQFRIIPLLFFPKKMQTLLKAYPHLYKECTFAQYLMSFFSFK